MNELDPDNGGDGSAGILVVPEGPFNSWSVSNPGLRWIGDINNDGLSDLATVISQDEIAVLFGNSESSTPLIDLEGLRPSGGGDGSEGFVLSDWPVVFTQGCCFIHSEALDAGTVSDINNDGLDDFVVIGHEVTSGGDTGYYNQGFVIFGRDSGFDAQLSLDALLPSNGGDGSIGIFFNVNNEWSDITGGFFLGNPGLGDINGDGVADLPVGGLLSTSSHSAILYGKTALPTEATLDTFPIAGPPWYTIPWWTWPNCGYDCQIGRSIAAGFDLNGDGFDDVAPHLAVTDYGLWPDYISHVHVVFGRSGPMPAQSDLLAINGGDGSDGVVLISEGGQKLLGGLGDINGDGIDDLAVSESSSSSTDKTVVVFGRPAGEPPPGPHSIVCGKQWRFGEPDSGLVPGVDGSGPNPGEIYNSIASACRLSDGLCIGTYDGIDITGWYWADIYEIGGLFALISKHPGGLSTLELPASFLDGDRRLIEILGFTGLYASELPYGISWDGVSRTPFGLAGRRAAVLHSLHGGCISTDLTTSTYCIGGNSRVPLYRPVSPIDSDSDGVVDRSDNCTEVANFDQRDTDGDGFGNMCDPDFDGDEAVNFSDLAVINAAFFSTPAAPNWNVHVDLDGDAAVNFADLAIFKDFFFGTPGPTCVVP